MDENSVVEPFDLMPTFTNKKLWKIPSNTSRSFKFEKLVDWMRVWTVYFDHGEGFRKIDSVKFYKRFKFFWSFLGHPHKLIAWKEENCQVWNRKILSKKFFMCEINSREPSVNFSFVALNWARFCVKSLQSEAMLTTNKHLPLNLSNFTSFPSRSVAVTSNIDFGIFSIDVIVDREFNLLSHFEVVIKTETHFPEDIEFIQTTTIMQMKT